MRPVNLIPAEERRGEKTPLRTGPVAYAITGVLALVLVGITAVVLTQNKISDRRSEISSLKSQVVEEKAKAKELTAYTDFASMQQAREETVAGLVSSRFDWERVLNELAIVIPDDVWMTNVSATASGGSATTTSSSSASNAQGVLGPSLEIQGCARGHQGVAKFLAALRDVDGVTRVSVISSERPEPGGSTSASPSASSSEGDSSISCSTHDFISSFDVVAAFDNATTTAPTPVVPTTSEASTAEPASDPAESGSGDAQSQSGEPTSAVVSGTGSTP